MHHCSAISLFILIRATSAAAAAAAAEAMAQLDRVRSLFAALERHLLDDPGDDVVQPAKNGQPSPANAPADLNLPQSLQQLLMACMEDPLAAQAVFYAQDTDPTSPAVYPLLLSSLQQGQLEAGQLLYQQGDPPHQQRQQQHQQHEKFADGTKTSVAGAVAWPPMVLNRLALLAVGPNSHKEVAVAALRLLATAAAAYSNDSSSSSSSSPAPFQQVLRQLQGNLSTLERSQRDEADAQSVTDLDTVWPFSLGPDGVAAAAHLVTNLNNVQQPPTQPAAPLGSSNSSNGDSAESTAGKPQAPTAPTAATAAAAPPVAAVPLNHSTSIQLLLQLYKGIQHRQSAAATAAAAIPHQQELLAQATKTGVPSVGLQLQMLTDFGNGQTAHILAELVAAAAAAAVVQPPGTAAASVAAAATVSQVDNTAQPAAAAAAAVLKHCDVLARGGGAFHSACCAACFEVFRCISVLLLEDTAGAAATDTRIIQSLLQAVVDHISVCPKVTVQHVDWSGKPTGFSLAPAPAVPCKTKVPKASAGAAAAAAAAGAVPIFARMSPLSFLAPAWHLSTLSGTYTSWLQAWGLREPSTTLQALLLLLLAVCQAGSWSAAAVLYGSDVSSVLEQMCGFADPGVQAVVQKLYRCLCIYSGQLRDEVMQDARIVALQALVEPSPTLTSPPASAAGASAAAGAAGEAVDGRSSKVTPPLVPLKLQAAAMSRLSSVLDGAAGEDFLYFVGAAAGGQRRGSSGSRRGSSSSSSNSGSGLGAVVSLLRVQMGKEAQGGVERALLQDARQVFLTCLNRSRTMQHLTPQQLPRGGLWSTLDGATLRTLEAWCKNPTTAPPPAAAGAEGASNTKRTGGSSSGSGLSAGSSSTVAGGTGGNSRRRAGSAVSGSVGSGVNAAAGTAAAEAPSGPDYDEDGLREVWSSGPSAATLAARNSWKQLTLAESLTWTQSSSDVEMRLLLPAGTRKQDIVVSIQPDRLVIRLNWYGRVLDGPLKKRIKSAEACWSLDSTDVNIAALKAARNKSQGTVAAVAAGGAVARGAAGATAAAGSETAAESGLAGTSGADGSAGQPDSSSSSGHAQHESQQQGVAEMTELLVLLPKEESGRYWRALFEGGEEKSHIQVLQEALSNEDDARHAPTVDELGPEAAVLLEELRERQELMVSGQWNIERSFDDFRLVLGDNMM